MEQMRLANSKTITALVVVSLTTNHWSSFSMEDCVFADTKRKEKKRKEKIYKTRSQMHNEDGVKARSE